MEAGRSALFAGLLRRLGPLDRAAEAAVRRWPATPQAMAPGRIVREEEPATCRLLVAGMAARYRRTADRRRQIVAFHLAGDLLELPHAPGDDDATQVVAISSLTVAAVPVGLVRQDMAAHPALADALWRYALAEAAIGREWLLNLGQRDGRGRLAHLLCELGVRVAAAGLGEPASFDFPLTQEQLGHALGLTTVHVNRTLRLLQGEGLIEYGQRHLLLRDLAELRRIAAFDPAYLRVAAEPEPAPA